MLYACALMDNHWHLLEADEELRRALERSGHVVGDERYVQETDRCPDLLNRLAIRIRKDAINE